ncbi:MAG: hypothetical protein KU37_03580 [Sulfuricurvum sp. PC08-66]|nr:MAG: hypothetical protein KU37_03580 [Sulfuricurvum sp. PC08-66]
MSNSIKVFFIALVVMGAIMTSAFMIAFEAQKVRLQANYDKEQELVAKLVSAALSGVKCDALAQEKESDYDILCRNDLHMILDNVFQQGVNIAFTTNNGAAFINKQTESNMDAIDPKLKAMGNFKPSTISTPIYYTDAEDVRIQNGVLTLTSEPTHLYGELETIQKELIKWYGIIGAAATVVITFLALLFMREKIA